MLNFTQITSTCVSMLSTPFPVDVPAPAVLPAFLLQLLEGAVQNISSSAGALRPLYLTIKGVGASILGVLPPGKLMHLQEELIKTLRNLDHSADLYCLAIFATLCTDKHCQPVAEDASSSQESESCIRSAATQTQDIYQPARQFFSSKKASKTLDVVVLRAIQSCSSASKLNPAQSIETLQLAREILQAVEPNEKAAWVQKNAAKVRKLYEKVRHSEADLGIRLAAFELISSLIAIISIPNDVVIGVEKLLQRPWTDYSMEGVMQAYAERFSDEFIVLRFTRALVAATECDISDTAAVFELIGLRSWVRCLTEAAKSSSLIRQTLLVALSSNKLQQPLQRFLTCKLPDATSVTRHERHTVCPAEIEESRQCLQREICDLLLRSAIHTTSTEVALDPSLASALLSKLTEAPLSSSPCQSVMVRPKNRLSAPSVSEVSNTPIVYRSAEDWRALLKEDLDRDSKNRHDLIIRRIDNVCRDLEARCDEVEKPLNEERERSKSLQTQLDQCQERCVRLEGEAEEQTLVLDSLQAEQNHLMAQRQAAQQSIQVISEALEEARAQLHLVQKEATDCAHTLREELRRVELEHCATIVAKDELIERGKVKSSSMESNLDYLREQLMCAGQEVSETKARLASALVTVTERDVKIQDLQSIIRKNKDDLNHQTSIGIQASGEVESLKEDIVALRSEADAMRAEHELDILKLNLAASESQEKIEYEVGVLNLEMSQQKSRYEEMLATLREESDRATNEKVRLTEEYDVSKANLIRKIERLNQERVMRAEEFAEAQDLSSKLVALMGKKPGQSTASPEKCSPLRKQSRRYTSLAGSSDPENIRAAPYRLLRSTTSSASGSTPKRIRVRRDSQPPSRHQIMIKTGSTTVKDIQDETRSEKRQPLEELAHNVNTDAVWACGQPPSEELHGTEPELDETAMQLEENNESQVMCDASFGGSYVFTSTDRRKFSSQDSAGVYDETTWDL